MLGFGEALLRPRKFISALSRNHVWEESNPSAGKAIPGECAIPAAKREEIAHFMGRQVLTHVKYAQKLEFKQFRSSLPLLESLCTSSFSYSKSWLLIY